MPTAAASGPADLVLRAYAGNTLLSELPLAIIDTTDECRDADSPASGSPNWGMRRRRRWN